MYASRPGLLIGFHGCDITTRNNLLNSPDSIKSSNKPYDWLGHGMYFWENNAERALDWANYKKKRGEIKTPAIIGAVLDLGYCCDFTDSRFINMVGTYYEIMVKRFSEGGKEVPQNADAKGDVNKDKLIRELDCTVIEFMHTRMADQISKDVKERGFSEYKPFDSVRGVFTEGGPIFKGAGILEKTHVQICIRNLNCIKGFFIIRKEIDFLRTILRN